MRFWRSSWFARRSASSSALATGRPVSSATAAVSPPIAATLPKFRFLLIAPPTESSCLASSPVQLTGSSGGRNPAPPSLSHATIAKPWYRSSALCPARGVSVAAWRRCNTTLQAFDFIHLEKPISDRLRISRALFQNEIALAGCARTQLGAERAQSLQAGRPAVAAELAAHYRAVGYPVEL